jgi:DNA-binding transcriptional ArsR family regulator
MSTPHPLPDAVVELIAERFRVIGEPLRIRILERLREHEASVGELTEGLHATQQNVSRHLTVLHGAGIVSRRKQGTRVIYAIADPTVFALCDAVCGSLQQTVAELAQLLGEAAAPSGTSR